MCLPWVSTTKASSASTSTVKGLTSKISHLGSLVPLKFRPRSEALRLLYHRTENLPPLIPGINCIGIESVANTGQIHDWEISSKTTSFNDLYLRESQGFSRRPSRGKPG